MAIYHYAPPVGDKTAMTTDDPAGWYEVVVFDKGTLVAKCYWWNSREWNHGPNMRRGFQLHDVFRDVRSIHRLY